jgi:hypothetical protein
MVKVENQSCRSRQQVGTSLKTCNFKRKIFRDTNQKKAVNSEVGRDMSVIFREKSEDRHYACLLQLKLLLIYHVR